MSHSISNIFWSCLCISSNLRAVAVIVVLVVFFMRVVYHMIHMMSSTLDEKIQKNPTLSGGISSGEDQAGVYVLTRATSERLWYGLTAHTVYVLTRATSERLWYGLTAHTVPLTKCVRCALANSCV
jgi:hypothetical protein